MNLLFLDVDGVLNGLYTKERVMEYCFVEDEKVQLLKEFVEKNNLKIVLSSTWRYGYYYEKKYKENNSFVLTPEMEKDITLYHALVEKLKEFELEIYDYTEMIDKNDRGLEINSFLLNYQGNIEKIVILDDINNVKPVGRFFVRTSMVDGLTERHIKKAEKILKEQAEGKIKPWLR
jgi:hypothetical protein